MLAPTRDLISSLTELSRRMSMRIDKLLLGATIALLFLGLVMVTSASISLADRLTAEPFYYLWRQLLSLSIGLALAGFAIAQPLAWWEKQGPLLLALGTLLLGLVLIDGIGHRINGAQRWIRLGGLTVQPSELIKLFTIIYLAGYLVRRSAEVRNVIRGFIKPIVLLVVIAGLLLAEPDFGTVVVLFTTALGMLFLGGVPLISYGTWGVIIGSAVAAAVWFEPYRMQRFISFLNPWEKPYTEGFQLTQALIAIGRGEWFGVGLGASVQKLFYLPEAHTDFLFAVLGEELGFVGMVTVIALFGVVLWRAFAIAARAARLGHVFGAHLAYGLGLLVGLQVFVNIGVNLGILPTKGLALPFLSFGGNSMLVNCVTIALLLRVHYETRRHE